MSYVVCRMSGAKILNLEGGKDMAEEDRVIGRPGTYTALGLDLLHRTDAFAAWGDALDAVFQAGGRGKAD